MIGRLMLAMGGTIVEFTVQGAGGSVSPPAMSLTSNVHGVMTGEVGPSIPRSTLTHSEYFTEFKADERAAFDAWVAATVEPPFRDLWIEIQLGEGRATFLRAVAENDDLVLVRDDHGHTDVLTMRCSVPCALPPVWPGRRR